MKNFTQFLQKHRHAQIVRNSFLLGSFAGAIGLQLSAQNVSVDSTFGVNGYIPYGTSGNYMENKGEGNRSVIQPDGKIIVAMDQHNPNQSDLFFYTYRYNADGTPDVTFGDNGVSRIFTGDQSKNKDIRLHEDGKIIVTGQSEYCVNGVCGASQLVVMRLKHDGSLDSTFATDGILLTSEIFGTQGSYAIPERISITSDGKYLLAGRGPGSEPFVARLNYDGTKDLSFATQGVYSDGDFHAILSDFTTDATGNIYGLTQMSNFPDTSNLRDTRIFKLTPDGVLDVSYGTSGRRTIDIGNYEYPKACAVRSDGKLVVTGYIESKLSDGSSGYGINDKGYVSILNTDGSNSSLTPQGFVMFEVAGENTTFIHSLLLTEDDKMLIGGRTIEKVSGNYIEKAFLAYLEEDVTSDLSFNGNGTMLFDYGQHSSIGALACFRDIDLTADGGILMTGYRNPISGNTRSSLFLLKLNGFAPQSTLELSTLSENTIESLFYPNPWQAQSRLDVTLNADTQLSLKLVDASGRFVHNFLDSEAFSAGAHSIALDRPAGVPGGTYLLVLTSSTGGNSVYRVTLK